MGVETPLPVVVGAVVVVDTVNPIMSTQTKSPRSKNSQFGFTAGFHNSKFARDIPFAAAMVPHSSPETTS